MVKRWTVGQSHFPVVRRAPSCETEGIPESIKNMSIQITITTPPTKNLKEQGWRCTTDLCVDVKTYLLSDRRAKLGKNYAGVLTRDGEDHYNFVESLPQPAGKRNPHVFKGGFITVTRKDDGSFQPNFRPMPKGKGFSLERYAQGVYNELCIALGGLIEEE